MAPIHTLIVPKVCSTVWHRNDIFVGIVVEQLLHGRGAVDPWCTCLWWPSSIAEVRQLVRNDEVMLRLNGDLNIAVDDAGLRLVVAIGTLRNLELIWLTGRPAPDFKTIADFRRDNEPAIRKVCQQFVALCRGFDLLDANIVAIDGSKFKAVNAKTKLHAREAQETPGRNRGRRHREISGRAR